jgi:hypothetical protein
MTPPAPLSVDPERLHKYLLRRRPPAGIGMVWWLGRRWILFAAGFYLLANLGPALLDGQVSRATQFSGHGLWHNLFLPHLCGLTVALITARTRLRLGRQSPDAAAAAIQQEWADLVRPGWAFRTLAMGLGMGLGIGVPVGALLAFGLSRAERPSGGVVTVWLSFIALTLLWTIPMAFLLRWGTLWFYRQLR